MLKPIHVHYLRLFAVYLFAGALIVASVVYSNIEVYW